MVLSGFAYGVTDSAANLLILWVWHHDTRRQRVNVAILNAMFTIGAFVTPMLIAASMHYLHGRIWPAYYTLATLAMIEVQPSPCHAARSLSRCRRCVCVHIMHAMPPVAMHAMHAMPPLTATDALLAAPYPFPAVLPAVDIIHGSA